MRFKTTLKFNKCQSQNLVNFIQQIMIIFYNICLYHKNTTKIIKPFTGKGNLLKFIKNKQIETELYDIYPKYPDTIKRDTIIDPPDYTELYNSSKITNYRESKDIARKRISFSLVYQIVGFYCKFSNQILKHILKFRIIKVYFIVFEYGDER